MRAGPRAHRALQRRLVALFPYLHAAYEGTALGYGVSYLLGGSYFSASLHALGLQVQRASPEHLVRPRTRLHSPL